MWVNEMNLLFEFGEEEVGEIMWRGREREQCLSAGKKQREHKVCSSTGTCFGRGFLFKNIGATGGAPVDSLHVLHAIVLALECSMGTAIH